MNWNDLRYFVAIAREGTLAAAAKALKVDQTTVGRRLAALEDALGAQLLVRTPDGFTLTPAGERAMAVAHDLDERIGTLEARVRGTDERAEGVVRIATNETFAVGLLLERLFAIQQRHPDIRLEVVTSMRPVNLLRRDADIAVRVAPRALPEQQDLVVRKVGTIAMTLFATRAYLDAHPQVVVGDGLRGHDVVMFGDELAEAPPGRWMASEAAAARPVLVLNSILGAAVAASTGAALALLPCYLASAYPSLERAVWENLVDNDVFLLVHPDLDKVARVRVVVDHIAREMERARDLLGGDARAAEADARDVR